MNLYRLQNCPLKLIQNELQDNNAYQNVKLRVKDGVIEANLLLLLLPSTFLKGLLESTETCDHYEVIIPDIEIEDVRRMLELLLTGQTKWKQTVGFLELIYDILRFDEKVFILDELDDSTPKLFAKFKSQRKAIESPAKAQTKTTLKQTFDVTRKNCCKYCLKYFPRLDQLNSHILSKHTKKNVKENIKCNLCGKEFQTEASLKSHVLSHQTQSTYICPYEKCRKSYRTYYNLMRHIKQKNHVYPGKDVYPLHSKIVREGHTECDICHRLVCNLEHHKNKHHSNESRKFNCEICDYNTDRSDLLRKHELRKHNIAQRDFHAIEKTFENQGVEWGCFDCEKSFDSVVEIEDHILLPNCQDIICKICKKKFKEKWNLKQHMKHVHENPQKFVCKNCNRSYSYKYSLTKHLKKCK